MVLSGLQDFSTLVFAILGTVGAIYAGIEGHPKSEYLDDVEQIQRDRWNNVCDALGPVFSDVYDYVKNEDTDAAPSDLSGADKAAFRIRQALEGRGDLKELESTLERLDEPERVYKNCRKRWSRSIKLYLSAIVMGVCSAFLVSGVNHPYGVFIGVAAFTLSGVSFLLALRDMYLYMSQKDRLDEMVEDVEFM